MKENTRENDCTKLFPGGRGCHLRGDDFHEAQVETEREKRAKKAAKELRKDKKAFQKKRKEEVDKLWRQRNDEYQSTVEKWTKLVAELQCKGTRLKDCPKKLGQPKKTEVEAEVDKLMEGGQDDGDASTSKDDEAESEGVEFQPRSGGIRYFRLKCIQRMAYL